MWHQRSTLPILGLSCSKLCCKLLMPVPMHNSKVSKSAQLRLRTLQPNPERFCLCRKGFAQTLEVIDELLAVFDSLGPQTPIDIDNAAQRESLDVIGRIGFGIHFGATQSLASESGANRALDALHGGEELNNVRSLCSVRLGSVSVLTSCLGCGYSASMKVLRRYTGVVRNGHRNTRGNVPRN